LLDVLPAILVHFYSRVHHPPRHLLAYGGANKYMPEA
jgi:hypothetical protein